MDWNIVRYGLGGVTLVGSVVTAIVFQQRSLNSKDEKTDAEKPYAALHTWTTQNKRTYIGNNKGEIKKQLNNFKLHSQGAQYKNIIVQKFDHMKKSLPESTLEKKQINKAQPNREKESEEWADFVKQWCEIKARDETIKLEETSGIYKDVQTDGKIKEDLETFKELCTNPT
ncbi:hypothetical protein MHSWG343_05560 [Candidatus Mycoplasma haematohominis]|uniref:Uncharacterized protein n=1 Tax=Candidatus Mycoplasma haematohominis TaxID=1494318 RepID=A0A478FSV5_9MOLU|nr:hypothetical protein MHSWG343_05560 [Candidatus Mycoplasma haemohominis]